jgi:hypothetical protein
MVALKDEKYNEFRVSGRMVRGKFVIDKKELTERGHVMITAKDAEINNLQTKFNFLHYEKAEVKKAGRPVKEK